MQYEHIQNNLQRDMNNLNIYNNSGSNNQNYMYQNNQNIPNSDLMSNPYTSERGGGYDEYEEMKQAYINSLHRGPPEDNSSGAGKVQGNYNQSNYNNIIPNNYNQNLSQQNQKQNVQQNQNFSRPNSQKNAEKEYKRIQQEEYRRALDVQMKEANMRKEQAKLEKHKNISDNNFINSPIPQVQCQGRMRPVSSNLYNNQNHVNEYNSPQPMHIPQHQKSPEKHEFRPVSHIHSNNNNNIDNIKELEKKKKLEYQKELQRQIEDKKKREVEEKKKKMEEDRRFEETYGTVDVVKRGGKARMVNPNQITDQIVEERKPQVEPKESPKINEQQQQYRDRDREEDNNFKSGSSGLTDEYFKYKNKQTNNPKGNQMSNSNNNLSLNPPITTTNRGNNYHYNNNDLNYTNNYQEETNRGADQIVYSGDNYSSNPNTYNQYNNYNPPQQPMPYSPNTNNTNINSTNGSTINTLQNQFNNIPNLPPYLENILNLFLTEQLKVINQYKSTIDKLAEERDKVLNENLAQREKMIALNELLHAQEKFKSNLGFNPVGNNFNKNIENVFNSMIDNHFNKGVFKTLKEESGQNLNENNRNQPQVGKVFFDERPISGLKKQHQKNNQQQGNPMTNSYELNPRQEEDYAYFRSKYEDLSQTMTTLYNVEDEKTLRQSLQCFTKLVKIPQTEFDDLKETWRGGNTSGVNLNGEEFIIQPENRRNNVQEDNETERTGFDLSKQEIIIKEVEDNEYNIEENIHDQNINDLTHQINREQEELNKLKFIQDKAKSLNFVNQGPSREIDKFNNVRSQRNFPKEMIISQDQQNESLIFDPNNRKDSDNSRSYMRNNQNNPNEDESIVNLEQDFENQNYCNNIAEYNPGADPLDNNSEYSETFVEDNEVSKYANDEEGLNQEDYKEIKEAAKFQTQVNFFEENSALDTGDKNIIPRSLDPKYHIVGIGNSKLDRLDEDSLPNQYNTNNFPQGAGKYNNYNNYNFNKPDPREKMPRDITSNNINQINNFYEKFKKEKGESTFANKPKGGDKVNSRFEESHDLLAESINNFNNNLRPNSSMEKGNRERLNTNNSINNRNNTSNNYKPPNSAKLQNIGNSYIQQQHSNYNKGNAYNNQYSHQYNQYSYYQNQNNNSTIPKGNPLDDLNNEDSIIKDLTKFRQFALNEINQSEYLFFIKYIV
jgi:hypothetical protein